MQTRLNLARRDEGAIVVGLFPSIVAFDLITEALG